VFHAQLLVECRDFIFKQGQRGAALRIGQLWAHSMFGASELLDMSHGVMHGPKLPLKLGEQIELIDGQHFCIELEELTFAISVGGFHIVQGIKILRCSQAAEYRVLLVTR
jgi:hypothetical protein